MNPDWNDGDSQAICLVKGGQRDAFALLVRKYQQPVLRLAKNVLRDAHEAEDVAQESFIDAYRNLDRFDETRSSFSTWLFTIAKNRCLKAMRKSRPVYVAEIPEAADNTGPQDDASFAELQSQLDVALDRLSEEQKIAFVLVVFVGLTPSQAAEVEGISPGTFRSRLSRARQLLQSVLTNPLEASHE